MTPSLSVAQRQCVEAVLRGTRDGLLLGWNCLLSAKIEDAAAENKLVESALTEIVGAYNRIDALLLKIRQQQQAQKVNGQQHQGQRK